MLMVSGIGPAASRRNTIFQSYRASLAWAKICAWVEQIKSQYVICFGGNCIRDRSIAGSCHDEPDYKVTLSQAPNSPIIRNMLSKRLLTIRISYQGFLRTQAETSLVKTPIQAHLNMWTISDSFGKSWKLPSSIRNKFPKSVISLASFPTTGLK